MIASTFKSICSILILAFALSAQVLPVAPSGPCAFNLSGRPVDAYTATAVFSCLGTPPVWTQVYPVADAQLVSNTTFGPTAIRVAHAQYSFAVDGGAIGAITPASNFTLPINAVITNVAINSTTAVTSAGSATVAIGTTAGSTASSLLAATAKATYSINAFVQGIPVPSTASTFVKLTAAGQAQITVATAALTAGVIEIYVFYYVSST